MRKKIFDLIFNFISKIISYSPIGFIVYTRKFISGESKRDYQNRFVKFRIEPGSLVLDAGSGGEPFPFANLLFDKYTGKTQHRYNELKINNLPFTVGDIQKLPYKDKSIDFLYTAHVLEHVENPADALNEILRVSKGGYIEVPTRMSDIIFNFARMKHFHKWHISMVGRTLIFKEYNDYERRDTGNQEIYYIAHSKFPNSVKSMYRRNKDLFTNMFMWKDNFRYYIFDKSGDLINCRT